MPAVNEAVTSTRIGKLVLSIVVVALLLVLAIVVWKIVPLPARSQSEVYALILLGPALGLSAHVSLIGVAVLALPVVLLLWRVLGWKAYRSVVSLVAIVYWLTLGAIFSIGAL